MDDEEPLAPEDAKNLKSGAMADAGAADQIVNQNLVLMARCQHSYFAVGTAFVLSSIESCAADENTTVIAVTAKHCLTNIPKYFGEEFPECLLHETVASVGTEPPWILVAGDKNGGLWQCVWGMSYIDDLQLLYFYPVNECAKRTTFERPLIGFGIPEVGDELWGFGFANCCYDPQPTYEFATNVKLTKGNVVQLECGTLYSERIIAALPFIDGMSGGPVFWAKMLFGIVSSTFADDGCGTTSFVMRVRHLWHLPISSAPKINGVAYKTCGDLGKAGIINFLDDSDCPQNEIVVVERHKLSLYFKRIEG